MSISNTHLGLEQLILDIEAAEDKYIETVTQEKAHEVFLDNDGYWVKPSLENNPQFMKASSASITALNKLSVLAGEINDLLDDLQ